MALVEEYYELNEAEEVSGTWKVLQITFYISAGCLGLWCGYTIALLRLKFNDKCYLFNSLKSAMNRGGNLQSDKINWENESWCDYCQYCMVSSFIVATIWATFFLMCGKGGKALTGLPQPWRIVWPSLIFNFIYFIVSLSTAVNIQKGTDFFCTKPSTSPKLTERTSTDCESLSLLPITDVHSTSVQLDIVTKTSWGCAMSWLILFLISFMRIIFVIDFNLYRICVFKIGEVVQNKKEEILRVTNYEEPRRIHFEGINSRLPSVQFEDRPGDKNRKGKTNKRLLPIQPNAAFYVTTDLRSLNREKQIKKSFKLLDSTFDSHKTNLEMKLNGKHLQLAAFDVSRRSSPLHQFFGQDNLAGTADNTDSEDGSSQAQCSIRNRNASENKINNSNGSSDDDDDDLTGRHKKYT